MNTAFLEIGGNQGDKLQLIAQAKKAIEALAGNVFASSSIYESEAWGFESSSNFYNQVLGLHTKLSAGELLSEMHKIEAELGRVRGNQQFASRTMDIDILLFNQEVMSKPELQIPHPRIQERKFVLLPLVELIPKQIHPVLNKSFVQLLQECKDAGMCKKLD